MDEGGDGFWRSDNMFQVSAPRLDIPAALRNLHDSKRWMHTKAEDGVGVTEGIRNHSPIRLENMLIPCSYDDRVQSA